MRLEWGSSTFVMLFVLLKYCRNATGDYDLGYFQHVLRSKTASACEGHKLRIKCPFKTTISIEKTANECRGKRICQLLVHPRVFGNDPCPGTTKYLSVDYKCRLIFNELREAGTCPGNVVKLRCPRSRSYIAIYNVQIKQGKECFMNESTACKMSSDDVFDYVTSRCHKRSKCTISSNFCDGYLHIKHACVPKSILTSRSPSSNLSFTVPSLTTNDVARGYSTTPPLSNVLPKSYDMLGVKVPASDTSSNNTDVSNRTNFFTTATSSSTGSTRDSWSRERSATVVSSASVTENPHFPTFRFSASIEATNEFPMLSTYDQYPPNDGGLPDPTNSTFTGEVQSNFSQSFYSLNSFVQLFVFLHDNSDRALAIVLGSCAVVLFFTLLVVFYYLAFPEKRGDRTAEGAQQEEERTHLMSPQHPNASSGEPGSGMNLHAPTSEHIAENHLSNRLQSRKKEKHSAGSRMLRKFCSCCCSNAPWQRADLIRSEEPIHPRSNSLSEDDIISINGAEDTPQFQGPLPYAARRDSVDAPAAAGEQSLQNEDTTSEYEFPDLVSEETNRPERPTTLLNFSNSPMTLRNDNRMYNDQNAVLGRNKHYTMQPQMKIQPRFYPPRREPPPFPRQAGYIPHQQTVPHSQQRWPTYQRGVDINAPHSVSPIAVQQVPLRSARYNHYVSLQPSSYETAREGRRDSFYDNSLPRDSALYEYYQQLQQRQELPGTRNINQYFS